MFQKRYRRGPPIIIHLGDLWIGLALGIIANTIGSYLVWLLLGDHDWKLSAVTAFICMGVGVTAKIRNMVHMIR